MEKRYVVHKSKNRILIRIVEYIFLVILLLIVRRDILEGVVIFLWLSFYLYHKIKEYKMIEEEYIILTEKGIKYTYSKDDIRTILWKDIETIWLTRRRRTRAYTIAVIEYKIKGEYTECLSLEYALENNKEIYKQMIEFWETYK